MSNFTPLPKKDQLTQKKKDKSKGFGQRKNKGNFGKTPSKPMKKTIIKKKRITNNEELAYLQWFTLQTIKCFNCNHQAEEGHHVKEVSSDKKDHKRVLPLCSNCHNHSQTLSVHGTPVKWRERYTIEEQLEYAKKIYEQFKREMN